MTQGLILGGGNVKVLHLIDGRIVLLREGDSRIKIIRQEGPPPTESVEKYVASLRELAEVIEKSGEALRREPMAPRS